MDEDAMDVLYDMDILTLKFLSDICSEYFVILLSILSMASNQKSIAKYFIWKAGPFDNKPRVCYKC